MKPIKCVIVGDSAVGKTSLILACATNGFPEDPIPHVYHNTAIEVKNGNKTVIMEVRDTGGGSEYDLARPLTYTDADVYLLCFSVGSPTSYHNIMSKWYPELCIYGPKTPIILVGTKTDLRQDKEVKEELEWQSLATIEYERGVQLMKEIGAATYMECSSLKERDDVQAIFEEAAKTVQRQKRPPCIHKSKRCCCCCV